MKNIFKIKRHPPRSNDIATPSTSSSSPPPPISPQSCAPEPQPPSSAPLPSPGSAAGTAGDDRPDYFLSEEEFQMDLALAISASNSEFPGDPDGDQIRAATLLSLGRQVSDRSREVDTAESLSRRYWEYNVLDYNEKVVDGFYDIFALSTSDFNQGKMPSLVDLQTNLGYEVILVNRAIDPALVELEQVVQCIQMDCPVAEMALLVQRMSELVTQHMGGSVGDANDMIARWMEKSTDLRTSLNTSLFPIGCINVGLSRHRALLFKVLSDVVGIPCRLVKGSHYTGGDDDAVNIIKLDDGREFLVDLMAAPGTLIPADVLSIKDIPLNPYSSRISKTRTNLPIDNLEDSLKDDSLYNMQIGGVGTSASNDNDFVDYNVPSSAVTGSSYSENTTFLQDHPMQRTSTTATTSKEKGVIEAPTVSDNTGKEKFGIGVNSQYHLDSRDLFAELNPFQVTVVGKASAQYKFNDVRNGGYQNQRENTASGPVKNQTPLIWKGRYPRNEVPDRKQNSAAEGSFLQKKFGELNPSSSQQHIPAGKNYSNVSNNVAGASVLSHTVGMGNSESKTGGTFASSGYSSSAGNKLSSSADERQHDELKHSQYADAQVDRTLISSQSHGESYRGGTSSLDSRLPQEQGRRRHNDNENVDEHQADLPDTVPPKLEQQRYVKKKLDPKKSPLDRFMGVEPISETAESSTSSQIRHISIDPMLDDVAECEILWEHLVIGERIGLGSYGEVYRADWNGTEVAVKKFLDQDFYGHALDEFRSEVRIMRRLRNPNVVLFLGAVTRPPNLSIVTEFLPRGSLYRILHRPNCQIDEKRRIKMALDVAKGMNCLHKSVPTIVHRDLKSPNLLVDNNWTVKVCDFGLSRLKHNTFLSSKSTAGTPEWMAPEVLRNEPSNEKCDIYSFGVILWELATLRMPWSGMNPMQVVGAVGFQDRRLEIPKEVDPLVARIIWECWQTDPSLRPSFDQLTIALKSLQRLVIPSHQETQSSTMPQEIPVHLTP